MSISYIYLPYSYCEAYNTFSINDIKTKRRQGKIVKVYLLKQMKIFRKMEKEKLTSTVEIITET